ncbi:uncharacterized protein [Scyliorhinus torazame]|uniref:uncharacterized protein n=1 Tax=Scyliorhinus torazame TaxID=75743 RepID=UPI003B5AD47C
MEDHTGFIKGRQLTANIRRLLNLIVTPPREGTLEVIISRDTEKENGLEWRYLMEVLERFVFEPAFTPWVKLLYSASAANTWTNTSSSEYFRLHSGTRQGCPLSPLLFALATEP